MNRGDVVEVEWLYTDLSGSKVRPAVVVQRDLFNHLIDDTILVQITGTLHAIPGTEVLLDPAVEASAELSKICVASCLNITTFEQARIYRKIGYLSDAAMQRIEECLKIVMEIRRENRRIDAHRRPFRQLDSPLEFLYPYVKRWLMIRLSFPTDQDRVKGNYLLATNGVVRRLRGQIFETTERGIKLLDEHQIAYAVLPIPEPSGADQEGTKSSYR